MVNEALTSCLRRRRGGDLAGRRINGGRAASQSVIDAASPVGISGLGEATHAVVTTEGDSTSPALLDIAGRHAIAGIVERSESRNGLSLAGRYGASQIIGTNWSVSPPSGRKGGGLCFDTRGVI